MADYFQPFQDKLKDGGNGPVMLRVPAGSFQMGDPYGDGQADEVPVHRVTIARDYAIGKFEITYEEFDRFTDATGLPRVPAIEDDPAWGRGRQPVTRVSYFDAVAYTQWLSEQTGYTYQLPSEAQWDYAARAGTSTRYWWGDELRLDMANCYNCSGTGAPSSHTTPAGSFPANPWGLHDTVGNVWEWTASLWEQNYGGQESRRATPEEIKVLPNHMLQKELALRSGSWNLYHYYNRSASRYYGAAQARTNNLGFRVMREIDPQ